MPPEGWLPPSSLECNFSAFHFLSLFFFGGGRNSTKSQQQHVPRQTLSQIRSFNETELRLHVAGSGSAPCKSVLNTEPRLHLLCICFPRAWNMQTSSTSVNVLEQKKVLLKLCVIFQIFLKMFLKAAIKNNKKLFFTSSENVQQLQLFIKTE